MQTQQHTIWQTIEGAQGFENFKNNFLPPFEFRSEVSPLVKKQFVLVKKLLDYSYYEYEFLEVALTQAVTAMEKNFRIRYREIEHHDWQGTYDELISWFRDRGCFHRHSALTLSQLRTLKKDRIHQPNLTIGGFYYIRWMKLIGDMINEVYE
ncbi:MAG: hypothetical protein M3R27_09275 [Bacteroidota bacterium]|nr:hypothetical protein [Bacteroidota bacterium]